ncbi:hypothetical protein, partial [Paraglaciecola polaris]|uniref:hypothetical protein n=1 Tax=Paraglaciecola polaris TaxID=222814 RepID=UPI0030EE2909
MKLLKNVITLPVLSLSLMSHMVLSSPFQPAPLLTEQLYKKINSSYHSIVYTTESKKSVIAMNTGKSKPPVIAMNTGKSKPPVIAMNTGKSKPPVIAMN